MQTLNKSKAFGKGNRKFKVFNKTNQISVTKFNTLSYI